MRRAEPGIKVGEGAAREHRLAVALVVAPDRALRERWEEAEIDVHRLEGRNAGAAGDVRDERAHRRGRRRRRELETEPRRGGEAPGEEADRGALDITFDAGDL